MLKPWKTIQSRYVLNTPWLKVKCEDVRLPDGRQLNNFYSLEGGVLVAVLVLDAQDRVLLVRQYRQAIRRITVDLPGGMVEKGERPQKAAQREVLEETGYRIVRMHRLLTYYPDSGKKGDVKHIYVASLKDIKFQQQAKEDQQMVEFFWEPFSELYKRFRSGKIQEATLALALAAYTSSQSKGKR